MLRRPDNSIRFELIIVLTVLSFMTGLAVSAWCEKVASDRTALTRDGILSLVSNIRAHSEDEPFRGTSYDNITTKLVEQQLVPPEMLHDSKLRTAWDTPVMVSLNLGSAVPAIEVSLRDLSKDSCRRLINAVSKRFANVNDLRSIWIGPPGTTLNHFPIAIDQTGCKGSKQEIIFQFHLKSRG